MKVEDIKRDAIDTKKGLLKKKKMGVKTTQVSVEGLIKYCDKVLFLCKYIERKDKDGTA